MTKQDHRYLLEISDFIYDGKTVITISVKPMEQRMQPQMEDVLRDLGEIPNLFIQMK